MVIITRVQKSTKRMNIGPSPEDKEARAAAAARAEAIRNPS
jgi:hypothetical protein